MRRNGLGRIYANANACTIIIYIYTNMLALLTVSLLAGHWKSRAISIFYCMVECIVLCVSCCCFFSSSSFGSFHSIVVDENSQQHWIQWQTVKFCRIAVFSPSSSCFSFSYQSIYKFIKLLFFGSTDGTSACSKVDFLVQQTMWNSIEWF